MTNLLENCCICISTNAKLIKLSETDTNQVKWSRKLSQCVPEVDWDEACCICPSCIGKLEIAYTFYHLCLQSYEVRKQQVSLKIEEPVESKEIFDFIIKSPIDEEEDYMKNRLDENEIVPENNISENEPQIEEKFTFVMNPEVCSEENQKEPKKTRSNYPQKCDYCSNEFSSKRYLDVHVRTCHSKNNPFICSSCGKMLTSASGLSRHTKIHLNKRLYKCNQCDKSFNTANVLLIHKTCVHVDPKLWKHPCTICEKRFPMKSNLMVHIRRHTGEKNFECHICGKRFVNKDTLSKHLQSHTDERLCKCHLCEKEYKHRGTLNLHLKREHDVGTRKLPKVLKKHSCNFCSKAFVDPSKLKIHIRTHTGEKPFSCIVCKKKFKDGWYLKVHLRSKHAEETFGDDFDGI